MWAGNRLDQEVMIMWDIGLLILTILSDALKLFFSLSVIIGGAMVDVLILVYHCSLYLLLLVSNIIYLLICIINVIWTLACAIVNEIYSLTIVLFGCLLTIGHFIHYTAGPVIINVLNHLLHGLIRGLDYCYNVLMTVLHYLTAMMLRIIDTLPGIVQPLATDVVHYGSDIVAMVITSVFNVLRWMITSVMEVMGLSLTIVLAANIIILCLSYYYYTRQWSVARVTPPMERRESREESNRRLQSTTEQCQSIGTSSSEETDSVSRKMEKLEEEMLCVVCQDKKKTILLQPCNHVCLCENCVTHVMKGNRRCPICRKYVKQQIYVFL